MENHNLIKLASKYCRGLGDYCKRKGVFNYLRDKTVGIYCLQDTHFRSLAQLDTPLKETRSVTVNIFRKKNLFKSLVKVE